MCYTVYELSVQSLTMLSEIIILCLYIYIYIYIYISMLGIMYPRRFSIRFGSVSVLCSALDINTKLPHTKCAHLFSRRSSTCGNSGSHSEFLWKKMFHVNDEFGTCLCFISCRSCSDHHLEQWYTWINSPITNDYRVEFRACVLKFERTNIRIIIYNSDTFPSAVSCNSLIKRKIKILCTRSSLRVPHAKF